MRIARFVFVGIAFVSLVKIHSQSNQNLQSPLNRSIEFLQNYLSSDTGDYNIAFLAKYLSVYYNRKDLNFDLEKIPVRSSDEVITYNFYPPLIGSAYRLSKDSLYSVYKHTSGLEHIMLWGVHADKIALDSAAKQTIIENSRETANIRGICHVAISIHWAKNKMNIQDVLFVKSFEKKITTILIQKMKSKQNIDDDFMEGLIGLVCLNKKKLIKKDWINRMIQAQNIDGGWAWGFKNNSNSHAHTTILAYWIILELAD